MFKFALIFVYILYESDNKLEHLKGGLFCKPCFHKSSDIDEYTITKIIIIAMVRKINLILHSALEKKNTNQYNSQIYNKIILCIIESITLTLI